MEGARSADEYFEFVPYAFTRKAGQAPSEYPSERCVLTVKAVRMLHDSVHTAAVILTAHDDACAVE